MQLDGENTFTSMGPQPFAGPAPVFFVGTYDSHDRPNIMAAAMAGLCCTQPPCVALSVNKTTWTHSAIEQRGAFTLSIPSSEMAGKLDFCGLASGRSESKFYALGLTPAVGEHVDAPYIRECPMVIELLVRQAFSLGAYTQFVGEIMDVKIRSDCLMRDGMPDPAQLDALTFFPLVGEYYKTGVFAARAFAIGKTILRVEST
ncbi:MAG: flavin reductase family protein [Mailhella sp.]|nr:flavin reductase family protein [Mailhella sp.]